MFERDRERKREKVGGRERDGGRGGWGVKEEKNERQRERTRECERASKRERESDIHVDICSVGYRVAKIQSTPKPVEHFPQTSHKVQSFLCIIICEIKTSYVSSPLCIIRVCGVCMCRVHVRLALCICVCVRVNATLTI